MFGMLNILNIIYNYNSHGCRHFWSPSLPAEHYYLVSWVWSVVQEHSAVQTCLAVALVGVSCIITHRLEQESV